MNLNRRNPERTEKNFSVPSVFSVVKMVGFLYGQAEGGIVLVVFLLL